MIRVLKDTYKMSLVLATIFFIAILIAAYRLYSLPGDLMLTTGYQPVLTKTYLILAVAFLAGAFSIYLALMNKRELVVYKERSDDASGSEQSGSDSTQKSTISLDGIRTTLNRNVSGKDRYQGFLNAVCTPLEAGQGAFYVAKEKEGIRKVELSGGYALSIGEGSTIVFDFGEGLIGQAAAEGRTLYIDDIPEGYIKIISGLGSASPRFLLIVPVKDQNNVLGIIEIASFTPFSEDRRNFVEEAAKMLASKIVS